MILYFSTGVFKPVIFLIDMRILFVHSIGKNKFGGGEKWLITAATGLRDRGHEVIVGGRPGSRLLRNARLNGLETLSLNILSDLSIYHVFRIAFFLKTNKIDVLITKGRDLAIAGTAAKIGGNPLVLVRHGLPLRSSLKKHKFLHKKLAHGIITNTKTIKDLYESNGWTSNDFVRVIYNGTHAGNDIPSVEYSQRFPGKKVILTVGRLARQKGYFHLIDAVAKLKEGRDDFVFVVLGEGRLRKKLVAYADKKDVSGLIHFEGFVENVVPYIKGCDLFVLPSLYEGMPNATMEAMAHGKPVVMTNVNGAAELIPDEGKGLLIPPGDPDAIVKSVVRLLSDRKLSDEMGERAKKHIEKNFTVNSMIENIESYIEEKLSEKNQNNHPVN